MFDIDFFKLYNDHFGHVKGDECLRRVAETLASAANRPRDFFARYGGEEFALVLPATDEDAARTVAERCRGLIFKEQIPHEASPVGQLLTISLGVGTVIPARDAKLIDFIEEVDRRLYRAKRDGRNRVANRG